AFARTVTLTDALNNTTTYGYSDVNRSMTVLSQEGLLISTVHNRHGQTVTVTDPANVVVSTLVYDKNGAVVNSTNALNQTSTNSYDVRGLLTETTDASGRKVAYSYDAVGRVLTRSEDAATLNLISATQFDGQGRQIKVTDASGRITTMSYDQEGRLLTMAQDPSGLNLITQYAYDAAGRQVTVTEGAGSSNSKTTQYNYDVFGRRDSEIIDPGIGKLVLSTNYLYDANDNVVQRTDGTGKVARFVYDEANRRTHEIDPNGGVTKTTYDADGRVVAVRSYATAITVSDLSSTAAVAVATIKPRVDAIANEAIDPITYRVYDRDSRVRFSITNLTSTSATVTEQRYDTAGRVSQTLTYPVAATVDAALKTKLQAGTVVLADMSAFITANESGAQRQRYVYDAAGRVVYTIDALGAYTRNWYDAAGRVVSSRQFVTPFSAATLNGSMTVAVLDPLLVWGAGDLGESRVYDAAGRLVLTYGGQGQVTRFDYDAANRLLSTRAYTVPHWVDGTVQNKLFAGTASVADFASFTVANDASAQRQSLIYDAAGRLRFSVDALGDVTEQRYDAAGRVTQTLAYTSALLAADLATVRAGTATLATFSAFITANESGAQRQRYVYDAAGRVVYTIDALGAYTR
ncbi:MAG: hypothetical protein ACREPB_04315, partial [Arenimonas sp.]